MKNYYETLGVGKDATDAEIKRAYRRLARKYHPDVSTEDDATAKFQEVQEAYSVLKDEGKRRIYDNGGDPNAQPGWGQSGNPFSDINIEDILGHAFRHFNQARAQRVHIYETRLTLEEAYTGVSRTINGHTFQIPAGVRTGNRLRVEDFLVTTIVLPHNKFRRANNDLLALVSISVAEAIKGTSGIITHLDGTKLKFTIPAATQPGQVLRLAGKGMPNPEYTGYRGDLLLQIDVRIPTDLTEEQKDAIMSLEYRDQIEL